MNSDSTVPPNQAPKPRRRLTAYGLAISSSLLSLVIGYIAFTAILQPHTFTIWENWQAILLAFLLAALVFWRVLILSALGKIIVIILSWGIAWAAVAATGALVLVTVNPDAGHVGRAGVVFIVSILSAAFGLLAGVSFAVFLFLIERRVRLGPLGRAALASIIGGTVGVLLMLYNLHTPLTVALAVVTSLTLALCFAKSTLQNFHRHSN